MESCFLARFGDILNTEAQQIKGYGMASWSNQKVEVTSDPMISHRNKNLALGLCVVCVPVYQHAGFQGIPSVLLVLLFKMYLILPFFILNGLV